MKSVMEHSFSRVPKAEIPRASFDRSHGHKTSFDAGWLIPIFVDEALPGDTFNMSMTSFARLATPIFPIMDNMTMDFFFFAIPNRLLWVNWERFCGSQDDPTDSIDFTIPTFTTSTSPALSSIYDYMGIPPGKANVLKGVSALPFRAYNLIYDTWFRDQNLQDSLIKNTDDGPDSLGDYNLVRRGKRHDYFTSALPWPQKGDSVDLPLGTRATVATDQVNAGVLSVDSTVTGTLEVMGADTAQLYLNTASAPAAISALYADLTTATAATINQLRQAFQIQKLLERDARGGTRYTEIIQSHFGVSSPDERLQRPEYLGGGRAPVIVNAIAQTSESGTTAQGTLAAIGTSNGRNIGFTKSFTEHCVLLGLVSVRADLTYQQGIERMWSRATRYDFYWPALSMIGEQSILNKELWYSNAAADDLVFGYQERYAEYRYKPSRLSSLFRSDAAGTLDAWHLSQDFATLPVLDTTFIQDTPPVDRIIAVSSEPHFIFDSYFSLRCARPMPMFGVPGLIDHF